MFSEKEAIKIANYIFENDCFVSRIGWYDLSKKDFEKCLIDKNYFKILDENFEDKLNE